MSTRPVVVSLRPRLAGTAALVVGLPLALGACAVEETDPTVAGSSADASVEASGSASATSSASSRATSEPDGEGSVGAAATGGSGAGLPFPANTEPDTRAAGGGSPGSVTAVRLGDQQGYDRVVFELGGTSSPGWNVRYDDDPRTQGEGAPVDLPGDAVLHVTITGTGYPFDTGQTEYSGGDLRGDGPVTAVRFGGVFEGQTQAFIGVDSKTPFRVFLEESPARVVVDVVDAS